MRIIFLFLLNKNILFSQNAKTENSVSESKERDEEESENEDVQRHVEFSIVEDTNNEDVCDSNKPNKLQRRDTPHHLKNKRIHTAVDKEKVASIIAQVDILYVIQIYTYNFFLLLFVIIIIMLLTINFLY